MAISTRLTRYLLENDIDYKIVPHFFSNDSIGTSITANVPLRHIAKAVLLTDHQGRNLMAVLPASHKISLAALNDALHARYQLMKEDDIVELFKDCERGAIPPLASAYHMNLVCEQTLDDLESIYIEAGDHKTLLHLDHFNFELVVEKGKHIHFSYEYYH